MGAQADGILGEPLVSAGERKNVGAVPKETRNSDGAFGGPELTQVHRRQRHETAPSTARIARHRASRVGPSSG